MKNKLIVLSGFFLGMSPVVALAQGITIGGSSSTCNLAGNNGTLLTVLCRVGQILNSIVPVLIALGVVYFVWGVISFVIAGDEEAKTAGRNKIIYGIIGLAAIIAVWGLVKILTNTFGVDNNANVTLPTVPVTIPGTN
jgi:hypothetical protein